MPETTLGPILRGDKGMTVDQLFAIAEALNLDPAWLVSDATRRTPPATRNPKAAI